MCFIYQLSETQANLVLQGEVKLTTWSFWVAFILPVVYFVSACWESLQQGGIRGNRETIKMKCKCKCKFYYLELWSEVWIKGYMTCPIHNVSHKNKSCNNKQDVLCSFVVGPIFFWHLCLQLSTGFKHSILKTLAFKKWIKIPNKRGLGVVTAPPQHHIV